LSRSGWLTLSRRRLREPKPRKTTRRAAPSAIRPSCCRPWRIAANLERSWSHQTPDRPLPQRFETVSTTNTTVTFDADVSASFNRWSIPVGLSAEYASVTTAISVEGGGAREATTQFAGGGVWYTGRRGVEIGALSFTQRDGGALARCATRF
jgi:hypothetical protein